MRDNKTVVTIANILLSILADHDKFIAEGKPESAEDVLDWFFESKAIFERAGWTITTFIRSGRGERSGVIVESGASISVHKPTN